MPPLSHLAQAALIPLHVAQTHARRLLGQRLQVERHKQGEGAVHAGDEKLPFRRGRVETGRMQHAVEVVQQGDELLLQLQCSGGGFEAVGGTQEQGVAEGLSQPAQG
ncbi:hypothetical protein G114_18817, partial [Aeromonas diversa CDC 2478-85]